MTTCALTKYEDYPMYSTVSLLIGCRVAQSFMTAVIRHKCAVPFILLSYIPFS
jgi:hypothetical protein